MPNIVGEFLPEYSPDYNLIELVWHVEFSGRDTCEFPLPGMPIHFWHLHNIYNRQVEMSVSTNQIRSPRALSRNSFINQVCQIQLLF